MVITNPRMVTHQKEVYYRLGIGHFDLTHKNQVTTAMDGHLPFLGWSTINQMMVTNQNNKNLT